MGAVARFHQGGAADWSIAPALRDFLARVVRPDHATLETGAGVSTTAFAASGARHICITPDGEEIALIRAYCAEHGIDLGRVDFREGRSEDILPTVTAELDLVLIDGGHGFPMPFIDWFYAGRRLRPGGLMVIDDVDIWTGRVLADFLAREPGWRAEPSPDRRACVFRLEQPFAAREWSRQPFVRELSMPLRRPRRWRWPWRATRSLVPLISTAS